MAWGTMHRIRKYEEVYKEIRRQHRKMYTIRIHFKGPFLNQIFQLSVPCIESQANQQCNSDFHKKMLCLPFKNSGVNKAYLFFTLLF